MKFERELAAKTPLAELIAEDVVFLRVNRRQSLIGTEITDYGFKSLFDNEWLDGDILDIYVQLLVETDNRFQVITSRQLSWELSSLNSDKVYFAHFVVEVKPVDAYAARLLTMSLFNNEKLLKHQTIHSVMKKTTA